MQETRLALTVDGVEIPAVLTVPEATKCALLLIPGSVNSDVDGNYAPMFPGQPESKPHVYLDLATQLAGHGVAVLRFAKRGPGTGCITRDEALAKLKYRTFPQRLVVAEAFLDELARRLPALPRAIAGHSEGAVVATLLAQRRSDLIGLILLSGPAHPLLRLMIWQRHEENQREGKITPELEGHYRTAMTWAAAYRASQPVEGDFAANPYAQMLPFYLQPGNESYLRSLEQVDPVEELAKTTQPVLIVQGGRDGSVNAPNADQLRAVRSDAQVAFFPELQHFYKPIPEGMDPIAAFGVTSESDPAVARAIASWLLSR